MASLVKDLRVSSLTRNNFFITAMVLLAIIALFFIPELIDFQKSFGGSKKKIVSADSDLTRSDAKDKQLEKASPLNRIVELLDSGYLDKLREKRMRGEPIEGDLEAILNSDAPIGEEAKASLKLDNPELPRFAGTEPLSWKTLKAASSIKALKDAKKRAGDIANSMEKENYKLAKYALIDFVNGINKVLDSGEKSMKAEDAVSYLSHLDQTVTDSFVKDHVDRATFLRWTETSLGPLFDQSQAQIHKRQMTPDFNPHLTLTYVIVKQPADRLGGMKPGNHAYVYIEGYVIGKEVKRMELYRDGKLVRRIGPHKLPDPAGRRWFKIPQRDARGIYTIRVYDKSNTEFSRSFNFYDRATSFPWLGREKGVYDIPFAEFDPRFTSYFMVSSGRTARSSSGFGRDVDFPMTQF